MQESFDLFDGCSGQDYDLLTATAAYVVQNFTFDGRVRTSQSSRGMLA